MSFKKIIVYQKNSQKPIILTDECDTDIDIIREQILNIFNSKKIYMLHTKNDLLIGRSTDLQSILISGYSEKNEVNNEEKDSVPLKYEKDLKNNG